MSRLFITPRELNFISDITKEIIKDVIGQKVYLYSVSEKNTPTHDVYGEAMQKAYDGPFIVDAIVDSNFQSDTGINQFGIDAQFKVEVYVQWRDLVEKGLNVNIGDFFSFGDVFYEITERSFMRNIYGMPEHKDGIRLVGIKARDGLFNAPIIGPTDISYTDPDAVQTTFEQQRGRAENSQGPTGDVRDLVRNGAIDESITGPKHVGPDGSASEGSTHGSSFYDED